MLRIILILTLSITTATTVIGQCTGGAVWVGGTPTVGTLSANATAQGVVNVSVVNAGTFASDRPSYSNPIISYNGTSYRMLRISRGGARAWNNASTTFKLSQALDSNIFHFRIYDIRGDGLNAETQTIKGFKNGIQVAATASNSINGGFLSGDDVNGSASTTSALQSSLRIHFNGPVDSVVITRASYGDYVVIDMQVKCTVLLPFELFDFTAKIFNRITELTWTVSASKNFDKYIIERSADSRLWTNIGTRNIVEYNDAQNRYVFKDETPSQGRNYYRLKSIDFDGTVHYSKIISVVHSSGETSVIDIQSNPFRDVLRLSVFAENTSTHIFSGDGRCVYSSKLGSGLHSIPLSFLKPGVYYLKATNRNGFTSTFRLIKQ